jgi:hypothetical protein
MNFEVKVRVKIKVFPDYNVLKYFWPLSLAAATGATLAAA